MSHHACVLVVDDEPLVRLGTAMLFSDAGYDVLEAANAADAVQVLQQHSEIELLFTDIDMPGSMNGAALAGFVRDRYPPIRIIVASGKASVADLGLPTGTLFLTKPYRDDAVLRAARLVA
jgi:two-component system, response regulator PdtaR